MHQTTALLIRRYRFSEASSVIVWLTEEHGKVKTVARSAMKQGGAFAGRLELFSEADIGFMLSSKNELHPLKEVVPSMQWQSLPSSYMTLLCASYFAQLCDLMLEPLHPTPEVFGLLRRALFFLQQHVPTSRAVEHFETELAKALGIYNPSQPAIDSLSGSVSFLPKTRGELLKRLI